MSENARPPDVRRLLALTAMLLGVVMTSLDNTVINVALPSVSRELHAGLAGTGWVVDAYLLSFATLLLTGGRLADTFGRRRMFLVGASIFTGASLAGALALNVPWLLMILVVAPLTGVLVRHVPARLVVTGGLVLLACGFLMLCTMDESSSYLALVPGMLLGGTGAALTIPLNGIALAAVPHAKAGVASGIFNTARETGGCVGVALTTALVSYGRHRSRSFGSSPALAFAAGYSDALLVAGSLTLGAALLTLASLRPKVRVTLPRPRAAEETVSVPAISRAS